jgi:hypothetical protein
LWTVTVNLQNLGTVSVDVAIIRYQVLQGETPVYAGAIVPADGKLGPFESANFATVVYSQTDMPVDSANILTVEVLELL